MSERNNMRIEELRQRMEVFVSTFYNLTGDMPGIREMADALGSEYIPVMKEYAGITASAAV